MALKNQFWYNTTVKINPVLDKVLTWKKELNSHKQDMWDILKLYGQM